MDRFSLSVANGERLLDRALATGIDVEHECGGTLACGSCCVIVREGADALRPASEDELDMLERAGVARPDVRLACQAVGEGGDVVIELGAPRTAHPAAGTPGDAAVSLTGTAARHFALQLARHPAAIGVRLSVAPAGCSGLRYRIDPASDIRAGDQVFESHGIRIVVDGASLPHLAGTKVDVAQEGLARRVRFDNPNARRSCGCGESFGT